jgi:hypothetical protein
MKQPSWQDCSEISINSELVNLKEIEANLEALLASINGGFSEKPRLVEALSFVQQANLVLSGSFGAIGPKDEKTASG